MCSLIFYVCYKIGRNFIQAQKYFTYLRSFFTQINGIVKPDDFENLSIELCKSASIPLIQTEC